MLLLLDLRESDGCEPALLMSGGGGDRKLAEDWREYVETSLPSDSRMRLASVVADPCEADDAVDRQRSIDFRAPTAGAGGSSCGGDLHLKVGGGTPEAPAMAGDILSVQSTVAQLEGKVRTIGRSRAASRLIRYISV